MDHENLEFYKFRSINRWCIDSIVKNTIHASVPKNLNDPFDCQLDLRSAIFNNIGNVDAERALFLTNLLINDMFFENWHKQLDTLGIYSFSLISDITLKEPLMWSHYADSHKGVCFRYSIPSSFFDELKYIKDKPRLITGQKVEYNNSWFSEFIKSSPVDLDKFITELLKLYLSRKSRSWAYENEGRIIVSEECNLTLPSGSLKEIIFGLNTSSDDKTLISTLAKQFSACDSFFQMMRGDEDYDLALKRLSA